MADARRGVRGRLPEGAQQDDVRKEKFLVALADTSHVIDSAKAAGVTPSTAYEWRRNDSEFYAAWMQALKEGYHRLELELLGRSRSGTETAIIYEGRQTGTYKHYDNRLALQLLAHHRATVTILRRLEEEIEPIEDVRARLSEKLTEMHIRLRARKSALAIENKPIDGAAHA